MTRTRKRLAAGVMIAVLSTTGIAVAGPASADTTTTFDHGVRTVTTTNSTSDTTGPWDNTTGQWLPAGDDPPSAWCRFNEGPNYPGKTLFLVDYTNVMITITTLHTDTTRYRGMSRVVISSSSSDSITNVTGSAGPASGSWQMGCAFH